MYPDPTIAPISKPYFDDNDDNGIGELLEDIVARYNDGVAQQLHDIIEY